MRKKNYSDAIANYTKAIECNAKNFGSFKARAHCYRFLRRFNEAISDSIKIAELFQNYASASYHACARDYYALKNFDMAIKYNTLAIEKSKHNHNTTWAFYHDRALAYIEQKKYKKAIMDYNEAIKEATAMSDLNSELGDIFFGLGDYQEAIKNYDQAIKKYSSVGEYYYKRGNAYLMEKNYEKAKSDYKQALEKWEEKNIHKDKYQEQVKDIENKLAGIPKLPEQEKLLFRLIKKSIRPLAILGGIGVGTGISAKRFKYTFKDLTSTLNKISNWAFTIGLISSSTALGLSLIKEH